MLQSRLYKLLTVLVILGLSACATTSPAPVEDRTGVPETTIPADTKASTSAPGQARTNANTYIVGQEENLYRIGIKTGIDYKEIAKANDIDPPYDVRVGQVLILPKAGQMNAEGSDDSDVTISTIDDDQSPITVTTTKTDNPLIPTITSPKRYREPYSESTFQRDTEMVAIITPTPDPTQTAIPSVITTPTAPKELPVVPPKKSAGMSSKSINWAWPHKGKVLRKFGDYRHKNEGKNNGLDISGKVGQPIKAAADGKVIYSGSDLRGYGKLVIIMHNVQYLSVYAHNSHLFVKDGQAVKQGQKIAELGSTEADRPKLHFEIRKEGESKNPQSYLPKL